MKHLRDALNACYDEVEGRGFFKVRGIALLLTVGAIMFVLVSLGILTVVLALLEDSVLGDAAKTDISIARWPLLAIALGAGLRSEERRGGEAWVGRGRLRW